MDYTVDSYSGVGWASQLKQAKTAENVSVFLIHADKLQRKCSQYIPSCLYPPQFSN